MVMMTAEMEQMSPDVLPTLLVALVDTMSGSVPVETNAYLSHSSVMVKMIARITVMRWDVVSRKHSNLLAKHFLFRISRDYCFPPTFGDYRPKFYVHNQLHCHGYPNSTGGLASQLGACARQVLNDQQAGGR